VQRAGQRFGKKLAGSGACYRGAVSTAISRRSWFVIGGLLAALLAAAALLRLRREEDPELCAALAQRRIVHLYLAAGARVECPGVAARAPDGPLLAALGGADPQPLGALLSSQKGTALALGPHAPGAGVSGRLGALEFVPGLRALALAPERLVVAPYHEPDLSLRERDALAYVARALLHGAREPALSSFPPALRRVERVEVMVLLRERGEARLWRSARGTSIARALLTATRVARERWRERESAMGGPLARRLLDLDVEVSLLSEDGVLLSRDSGFVDRAVGAQYGIGFEYKSGWHYLLPEDVVKRGNGSAQRALVALLNDQGLPPAVLGQSALRLYRFVALTLGVSKAPLTGSETAPPPTPG
jgi:hypothetical protein